MKGLTPCQLELMIKIKGIETTTGRLADLDQVLDQLSWTPTKASVQFTIRAIIKKGFLEKSNLLESRRGRNRVCFKLTPAGKAVLDPRELPAEKSEKPVETFDPELLEFTEPLDEITVETLE